VIPTINQSHLGLLKKLTHETANLGFYELLKLVYNESPEFAQNLDHDFAEPQLMTRPVRRTLPLLP